MSIKLELNEIKSENKIKNESIMQYLPFQIEFDGDLSKKVDLDKYFNVYTEEIDGVFYNAFRGYPLKGGQMTVPENYHGVIFDESNKPLSEEADRTFTNKGNAFSEFTYWNYDRVPSKNDALRKAFDWMDVSNEIHSSVNPDELAEFIQNEEDTKKTEE